MQKAFVIIDPTFYTVTGHKAGSLHSSIPEPNEIEVPFENFNYNDYIFKKYNPQTKEFFSDSDTERLLSESISGTITVPISKLRFQQLFTLTERAAIRSLQTQDLLVQEFNNMLEDAYTQEINLLSTDVQQYLDYLISKNIINQERKQLILSNTTP